MKFDAIGFYPSAIYAENSAYPKMETNYAFEPHMIGTLVNHFINRTFNQDGNESAILKMKYCDPLNLIF